MNKEWRESLKKAEAGDMFEQFKIATAYLDFDGNFGTGNNQDEAIKWLTLSADQGHPIAAECLNVIAREPDRMTDEESLIMMRKNTSDLPPEKQEEMLKIAEELLKENSVLKTAEDIIASLPTVRQDKIKKRSEELIADEKKE